MSEWTTDNEPASDDPAENAAVRQLRVRYDRLRADYEGLLSRLAELEGALAEQSPAPAPSRPSLAQVLLQPLLELRMEYEQALESIQGIVGGLKDLAARGMKGQHSAQRAGPSAPAEEPREWAEEPSPEPEDDESPTVRAGVVEVEVEGGDFGDLLDFQQQLSGIERVNRVSIRSLDQDRATLFVELKGRESSD